MHMLHVASNDGEHDLFQLFLFNYDRLVFEVCSPAI